MKQSVTIGSHKFEKTNLVTIKKGNQLYDTYKCSICGLEGKRLGLTPYIQVNKKVKPCLQPETKAVPKQVKVIYDGGNIGVTPNKIYDTVECPDEYKAKFAKDVWVMSDKRHEPVRLLSGEYTPLSSPTN